MNLTTNNITFLKDIPFNFKVDRSSQWRFYYFDTFNILEIASFIKLIGDDKIYLLIPFFASSDVISKPRLRLSDPFLVNNKSNSELIARFIYNQWESSGFSRKQDSLIMLSFKFKRVWISDK